MNTLDELIARLEKAEGPSGNINAAIMRLCEPETGKFGWSTFPYTASIDAAVAFMRRALKGVVLRKITDDDGMVTRVELVWLPNGLLQEPEYRAEAWHQYEAIALCMAVLRTLKAKGGGRMKLTKSQARKWVRDHFADYIEQAEWAIEIPDGVEEIAEDEQAKIVRRLRGSAGRLALDEVQG